MSKSSENVKRWRQNTKEKIVKVMGGCCQICGYDKCNAALELHHINPEEKEIGIAQFMANPVSWHKIVNELTKCSLLCANCHRELHAGFYIKLNSSLDKLVLSKETYQRCKNNKCHNYIVKGPTTYCSRSCRGKDNYIPITKKRRKHIKTRWDEIDVVQLLIKHNGIFTHAAKEIGISDNGVRKQFKRITGCKNWKEYKNNLG